MVALPHAAELPVTPGAGLRVCLVNVAPDHNKGACAIAWGLIRRLEETKRVDQITLVSTQDEVHSNVDYRHLRKRFPDIRIVPAILPGSYGGFSSMLQSRVGSYRPQRALLAAGEFALLRVPHKPGRYPVIESSDLVLNRGGPFLEANGPPPNFTLLDRLLPLLIARRRGIPYGFIGETVGRLSNVWAQAVVRGVVRDAVLFGLRERQSIDELAKSHIAREPTVMLDNAFWVDPQKTDRVDRLLDDAGTLHNRTLIVTCRPWGRYSLAYVRALAAGLDELVPRLFERVVFVSNTNHPSGPRNDDRAITRAVRDQMRRGRFAKSIEDDLSPDELASVYGSAKLVLGTRLHSLILALRGGAPVAGIGYGGIKTFGVLELVGLSQYIEKLESITMAGVIELVESALHQEPSNSVIEDLKIAGDRTLSRLVETL